MAEDWPERDDQGRVLLWTCNCGQIASPDRPMFRHAGCCDGGIRQRPFVRADRKSDRLKGER